MYYYCQCLIYQRIFSLSNLCNRDVSAFFIHYTGSRLLRIRLLRTPSNNMQVSISKMNTSHWHQCSKVRIQQVPVITNTFLLTELLVVSET